MYVLFNQIIMIIINEKELENMFYSLNHIVKKK